MGGLASFAVPMTAGSTIAYEQIIATAEKFPLVEIRASPVVKSAIVAHEPVGVVQTRLNALCDAFQRLKPALVNGWEGV